ncbi:hypothetical protein DEU56DRAFT_111009 [Suillus clintonianus]|uniref:uncharacterized protein n=1 Tax=Suillus clintonianus TaxID=1904413 RepID=UPI001B868635|nr:uncharacterized protein DEU56DRAFT_111009 [Suillus clintonianus]KAG2148113.1 hypothetical protein DEU56DRAFT_111009 [Suillus clintonianus]
MVMETTSLWFLLTVSSFPFLTFDVQNSSIDLQVNKLIARASCEDCGRVWLTSSWLSPGPSDDIWKLHVLRTRSSDEGNKSKTAK